MGEARAGGRSELRREPAREGGGGEGEGDGATCRARDEAEGGLRVCDELRAGRTYQRGKQIATIGTRACRSPFHLIRYASCFFRGAAAERARGVC